MRRNSLGRVIAIAGVNLTPQRWPSAGLPASRIAQAKGASHTWCLLQTARPFIKATSSSPTYPDVIHGSRSESIATLDFDFQTATYLLESSMTSGHSHLPAGRGSRSRHERPLWIALTLTTTFMLAEVAGGILTGSLALISDAAHMFTDTAALAISLAAIQIAKRAGYARRTFGYHRFEILAAAFNALLLFAVAIYILYEAWRRLQEPQTVASVPMLIIASLGLIVNLISMRLLSSGKDESLNVKGAYLEVWSDLLGSVGVIVGAAIIWFTGWVWVDSVIAVAIGLWVLPRTWILLRDSLNILLEGVPDGVDLSAVERTLRSLPKVTEVHELHIWAITSGKTSLSVHLVSPEGDFETLAGIAAQALESEFQIAHSTIQLEREACSQSLSSSRFH